jgi:3-oxoacyl-[acyl-carrier protein] reductase
VTTGTTELGGANGTDAAERRVALVTGANHGIGAATAKALAARGSAVLCAYFRSHRLGGLGDPSLPAAYRATRMARADFVVESIRANGGRAVAVEADLSDPESIPALFDTAERELGPVQILVNNASGWVGDTFAPQTTDRFGRSQSAVTARTIDTVIAVDARAAALLIAEFARRHIERGGQWGRIVGLTSGEANGFPEEV